MAVMCVLDGCSSTSLKVQAGQLALSLSKQGIIDDFPGVRNRVGHKQCMAEPLQSYCAIDTACSPQL